MKKGKFGIAALIFSSIAFAAPVSAPNNLSDTPIISGGGSVSGGSSSSTCRAYQTNGEAVPLSGGETLTFYGSGGRAEVVGGFLSTKSNYSGTAYVRVKNGICDGWWRCIGGAIGLFARNTDNRDDFIAGAGAGGIEIFGCYTDGGCDQSGGPGGGWVWEWDYVRGGVYGPNHLWFTTYFPAWPYYATPGFHGSYRAGSTSSSISAFYNSYTKNYTFLGTSITISGGGYPARTNPTLYVCK
jgi:hypothetical protein